MKNINSLLLGGGLGVIVVLVYRMYETTNIINEKITQTEEQITDYKAQLSLIFSNLSNNFETIKTESVNKIIDEFSSAIYNKYVPSFFSQKI
jgi:predicted PurR-regulated permease PerM